MPDTDLTVPFDDDGSALAAWKLYSYWLGRWHMAVLFVEPIGHRGSFGEALYRHISDSAPKSQQWLALAETRSEVTVIPVPPSQPSPHTP